MTINSISSNIAALSASQYISRFNNDVADSVTRLSSGEQLVRASDDIVALSAGTRLATQLASMRSAQTNVTQSLSMLDTASSGISQIIELLEDQAALAVSAQNGALTPADRANLDVTFQDLNDQIDALANGTTFNGISLLNGGMGTGSTLLNSDADAANFNPGGADISSGASAASIVAVQAFDVTDGSELDGLAAAGELELVDGADTKLTNNAFTNTDTRLYGQFSEFSLSNVTYGVSGTVTATINGADYSGTFNHNDTSVTLSNGDTNIRIRTSGLDVTDAGATAATEAQLAADFADTTILRTGAVSGVDFTGTALEGAVGNGTNPLVSTRLAQSGENVNISNFEYVGNSGAANSSVISVQVNGETFTATSVNDLIDDGAASLLVFENGTGEAVLINIAGQDTAITNIRTSESDRESFINALNNGFAQAGGGLTTNVSGDASDSGITMQIDSATSSSLYGGQSVDVTTTVNAAAAETAANDALDAALAIQAQIGATQARFNSAADYLTSATTNIDAARADYLDTDITEESTKLATAQVMLQAGVAALAQANQMPGYFLDILNSN